MLACVRLVLLITCQYSKVMHEGDRVGAVSKPAYSLDGGMFGTGTLVFPVAACVPSRILRWDPACGTPPCRGCTCGTLEDCHVATE